MFIGRGGSSLTLVIQVHLAVQLARLGCSKRHYMYLTEDGAGGDPRLNRLCGPVRSARCRQQCSCSDDVDAERSLTLLCVVS